MNNDRIKKLLVVDDEASHRMMIEAVLQDVGWLVEEAESGDEALQILEESRPSVVLLDMRMPGLSGVDVLRRLRGHDAAPGWKELPVFIVSGHAREQSLQEAEALGIQGYFSKPLQFDELLDAIRRLAPGVS